MAVNVPKPDPARWYVAPRRDVATETVWPASATALAPVTTLGPRIVTGRALPKTAKSAVTSTVRKGSVIARAEPGIVACTWVPSPSHVTGYKVPRHRTRLEVLNPSPVMSNVTLDAAEDSVLGVIVP